jgi:hypothetical protein
MCARDHCHVDALAHLRRLPGAVPECEDDRPLADRQSPEDDRARPGSRKARVELTTVPLMPEASTGRLHSPARRRESPDADSLRRGSANPDIVRRVLSAGPDDPHDASAEDAVVATRGAAWRRISLEGREHLGACRMGRRPCPRAGPWPRAGTCHRDDGGCADDDQHEDRHRIPCKPTPVAAPADARARPSRPRAGAHRRRAAPLAAATARAGRALRAARGRPAARCDARDTRSRCRRRR